METKYRNLECLKIYGTSTEKLLKITFKSWSWMKHISLRNSYSYVRDQNCMQLHSRQYTSEKT